MKHVLVIECDESTSSVLDEIMSFENCDVEVANCAAIAKDLLGKNHYDLVFADYFTLKNEKALDLLSTLNEKTKVFILSSFKNCMKDFKSIKYETILSKPFAMEDLINCLSI